MFSLENIKFLCMGFWINYLLNKCVGDHVGHVNLMLFVSIFIRLLSKVNINTFSDGIWALGFH